VTDFDRTQESVVTSALGWVMTRPEVDQPRVGLLG
jgi:hypothetical protein